MRISVTVNAVAYDLDVERRVLLSDALRDELGMTSVHAACDQGVCGSCTVLFDGTAIRSCLMFAVQADGHPVTTVEGVASPQQLHPVQEALAAHHGLQCGFCTPGMVLAAIDLLNRRRSPTDTEIQEDMAGNLCRCTGYVGIADAVAQCARSAAEVAAPVPVESGAAR